MEKQCDNNPKMKNSVVCFIDILGFSKMIEKSSIEQQENKLLKKISKIINDNIQYIKPTNKDLGTIKIFTDNIVIGLPIFDDGESELGQIFMSFANYQLSLALEGLFVRGGVSVGNYYADDIISFGPALLEAHNIENNISKTPRILLSKKASEMVSEHIKYYSDYNYAPQVRDILVDADGEQFINYLEASFIDRTDQGIELARNIMVKHKNSVEYKIKEYSSQYEILSKYLWVAQYHNYFCNLNFKGHNELLIKNSFANGAFNIIQCD